MPHVVHHVVDPGADVFLFLAVVTNGLYRHHLRSGNFALRFAHHPEAADHAGCERAVAIHRWHLRSVDRLGRGNPLALELFEPLVLLGGLRKLGLLCGGVRSID